MDFKTIVENELIRQDETRYQLALDCNRHPGWIYTILNRNSPSLITMQRITEAMGCKVFIQTADGESHMVEVIDEEIKK